MLFLIRHANAQPRRSDVHDKYRPLTDDGLTRAEVLAETALLQSTRLVLSSPATRCMQTVQPLAAKLGLEVFEVDELIEGSDITPVLAFLEELVSSRDGSSTSDSTLCSHGDLIPLIIENVANLGATVSGRGCQKGSIWQLTHDGKKWANAQYAGIK